MANNNYYYSKPIPYEAVKPKTMDEAFEALKDQKPVFINQSVDLTTGKKLPAIMYKHKNTDRVFRLDNWLVKDLDGLYYTLVEEKFNALFTSVVPEELKNDTVTDKEADKKIDKYIAALRLKLVDLVAKSGTTHSKDIVYEAKTIEKYILGEDTTPTEPTINEPIIIEPVYRTHFSEVKVGDKLKVLDDEFTCMEKGAIRTVYSSNPPNGFSSMYIKCGDGMHFLESQLDTEKYLIGLAKHYPSSI